MYPDEKSYLIVDDHLYQGLTALIMVGNKKGYPKKDTRSCESNGKNHYKRSLRAKKSLKDIGFKHPYILW